MNAPCRWNKTALLGAVFGFVMIAGTSSHAEETSRTFRIPAEPLANALVLFSEQSGLAVMAPADLVRDKTAPAVEGNMPPSTALDRLLKGPGLKYSRSADGAFTIVPAVATRAIENKPAAPRAAMEIEEITVTAQKREEAIQEIPVSITALTGATLEEERVLRVQDLGESVPNLRMATNPGSPSGVTITMRGVAQADLVGLQPAVGMYVDGAYIARIVGSNLDLEDLERVEVLRGPQGTLYGRNTIGGAINLITKKPTEERSITIKNEVGNYDTFNSRVTLNVPLLGRNGFAEFGGLGTLSLRENVGYKTHDGYVVNTGTSSANFDNENRVYNMTALRWQPTKDFTLDYSFEYHRYRDHPQAFEITYVYPNSLPSFPTLGTSPNPFYLVPYINKNRVDSMASNSMLLSDGRTHGLMDDGNHRMHILTGEYRLGEVGPLGDITLKSISSYRSLVDQSANDSDGSPAPIWGDEQYQDIQHWSEELQWIGSAPRVQYLLGAYYYGEYQTYAFDLTLFEGGFNVPYKDLLKTKSYAPYGQLTWTPPILSDKLSLTGGLRYTQEQVHADRYYHDLVTPSRSFTASAGKAFGGTDGISPMGNVAYQWTDDLMTYFRISRGFKGGGFNGSAADPVSFSQYFRPEKLLQYEAGFKSQWFDKRLRINADGFFSDYSDLQISVFRASQTLGQLSVIENAGKAEIWGMEFEGAAIPVRGVEATVNYSFLAPKYTQWLDQKYDPQTNLPLFNPNGSPQLDDVKDKRAFPYAPRHQVTVGLTYKAPPTSTGTFSAHVETYWQDQVDFIADNTTAGAQADKGWAYALVNGQLAYRGIPLQKGSLDLAVYARNLFDRKYREYGIDFGPSLGWAGDEYGAPRTFGLSITYNFTAS